MALMTNGHPPPQFIDLFSGCGGFSLGLKKAGFKELASIDFYPEALTVFRANFPDVPYVLEEDLTKFKPRQLAKLIGTDHVDLIVGGPPCQGFSQIRQVDGANSGERFIDDDRRNLFREFLKFVNYFKPKIFVMENVPGIRSAAGGYFFTAVQSEARKYGYRVHGEMIRAWEYGVPQKRQRQLIIGTLIELPLFSGHIHLTPTHTYKIIRHNEEKMEKIVTLGEAIMDLPPLHAGKGKEVAEYDLERRKRHLEKYGDRYLYNVLEIQNAKNLTAHNARPHIPRDLRDFNRLREGETSAQAIRQGKNMEFPYDRGGFKDRYTRQHRDHLCSTIVAHMSRDGLMFIHPTQNRSLTPREAARIQSFPDWFIFPVTRKHQYRLIGNAVPPLVGEAVGIGILKWFSETEVKNHFKKYNKNILDDEIQAIECLKELADLSQNGGLHKVSSEKFIRGWYAIAYLFGHLHPDSAINHGALKHNHVKVQFPIMNKEIPFLIRPVFTQSGWPLRLVPIAKEARNRFINGELSIDEYYFSDIQIAGLKKAKNIG